MTFNHALFVSLLMLSTPAISATKAPTCAQIAANLQYGDTLNKVMRRNPRHFFESKAYARWVRTSPYAQLTSMIFGDGHPNNLGPDYVYAHPRWTALDLDDVGTGRTFAGLAKSMALTKSATKEVKYSEMVEAFIKGLAGSDLEVPKSIRKVLAKTEEDVFDELEEYAERKSSGTQLEQLEEYSPMSQGETKLVQQAVNSLNSAVFLSGYRMKKASGGSADALRYRVLADVRIRGKQRRLILDMKETLSGNFLEGRMNLSPALNLEDVFQEIFEGDAEYRRVVKFRVAGKNRVFLLRPKIEFDALVEQPPADEDFEDFRAVSLYNISAAGRVARSGLLKTLGPDKLGALLIEYNQSPEKLKEDIKALSKAYLKELEKIHDLMEEDDEE